MPGVGRFGSRSAFRVVLLAGLVVMGAQRALAQAVSAVPPATPDDTPSIKLGMVLYADYTYTQSPEQKDADGNTVHFSQFNVGRSYINITGNVSRLVAFRITPDISRETGAGSSLAGSLEFRIKYAFAQLNLDDWMAKGSWVRLGIQQTPWVDFEENIYRYRFQGTVFAEREGFLSSSDAGASFHYNLPSNYGEVHVGLYNGETYGKVEVNGEKALQVRGSVRPFPTGPEVLRGLRAHVFYDGDNYVMNAERKRAIVSMTFEHPFLNAGFEFLSARDQTSVSKPEVAGRGYSVWATPRSRVGIEALLRYDHLTPNALFDRQTRNRTILGVAYWFPHQGTVSAAALLDYDNATFPTSVPAQPRQTKIALHGLVSF